MKRKMEEKNSTKNHPALLNLRGHFHVGSDQSRPGQALLPDSITNIFPITDEYVILVTSQSSSLINVPSQAVLWSIACPTYEAALDNDCGTLALAAQGGVFLWNLQSGLLKGTLNLGDDIPTALAFCPHGSLLAVALFSGGIQLWSMADGHLLHTLMPEGEDYAAYKSLAFSPDGQLLATGNFEAGEVWLWHVLDGQLVQQMEEAPQGRRVNGLAFSPDGKLLVCGEGGGLGNDLSMRTWEMDRGHVGKGFPRTAWKPVFRSDGKMLASVGRVAHWQKGNVAHAIIIWDVTTRSEIRQFSVHKKHVSFIVFSPSGRFLISGSEDQAVRWWEIESGKERYSL